MAQVVFSMTLDANAAINSVQRFRTELNKTKVPPAVPTDLNKCVDITKLFTKGMGDFSKTVLRVQGLLKTMVNQLAGCKTQITNMNSSMKGQTAALQTLVKIARQIRNEVQSTAIDMETVRSKINNVRSGMDSVHKKTKEAKETMSSWGNASQKLSMDGLMGRFTSNIASMVVSYLGVQAAINACLAVQNQFNESTQKGKDLNKTESQWNTDIATRLVGKSREEKVAWEKTKEKMLSGGYGDSATINSMIIGGLQANMTTAETEKFIEVGTSGMFPASDIPKIMINYSYLRNRNPEGMKNFTVNDFVNLLVEANKSNPSSALRTLEGIVEQWRVGSVPRTKEGVITSFAMGDVMSRYASENKQVTSYANLMSIANRDGWLDLLAQSLGYETTEVTKLGLDGVKRKTKIIDPKFYTDRGITADSDITFAEMASVLDAAEALGGTRHMTQLTKNIRAARGAMFASDPVFRASLHMSEHSLTRAVDMSSNTNVLNSLESINPEIMIERAKKAGEYQEQKGNRVRGAASDLFQASYASYRGKSPWRSAGLSLLDWESLQTTSGLIGRVLVSSEISPQQKRAMIEIALQDGYSEPALLQAIGAQNFSGTSGFGWNRAAEARKLISEVVNKRLADKTPVDISRRPTADAWMYSLTPFSSYFPVDYQGHETTDESGRLLPEFQDLSELRKSEEKRNKDAGAKFVKLTAYEAAKQEKFKAEAVDNLGDRVVPEKEDTTKKTHKKKSVDEWPSSEDGYPFVPPSFDLPASTDTALMTQYLQQSVAILSRIQQNTSDVTPVPVNISMTAMNTGGQNGNPLQYAFG